MQDKYKAHEILGIREDASREEIEKRYYILAKKHLVLKRENPGNEVPGLNMGKINEAYYQMIENLKKDKLQSESGIFRENENSRFYSLLSSLGINRQWAENFFYYYKNCIVAGAILLTFILAIIFPLFMESNKDDTVNIVFFGYFEYNEVYFNRLKEVIKEKLENIKEVNIGMLLIENEVIIPYKINMMLNAYNFITQGDYHILIMDKDSFREYGVVADIAKLDDFVKELDIKGDEYFSLKLHGNEEEHVYGISMDNSEAAAHILSKKGKSCNNNSLVVVMKDKFKDSKLHLEVIKALVESRKEEEKQEEEKNS